MRRIVVDFWTRRSSCAISTSRAEYITVSRSAKHVYVPIRIDVRCALSVGTERKSRRARLSLAASVEYRGMPRKSLSKIKRARWRKVDYYFSLHDSAHVNCNFGATFTACNKYMQIRINSSVTALKITPVFVYAGYTRFLCCFPCMDFLQQIFSDQNYSSTNSFYEKYSFFILIGKVVVVYRIIRNN